MGKAVNRRLQALLALVALVGGLAAGCGSSGHTAAAATAPVTVKMGYFPNVTHAAALVGVASGILARDLVPDKLDATQTFNAGPAETQALLSGAIDLAFIGPSPSISAFTQSHGAVTVISGAASGGAALVVKASITSPSQLKGTTLATPQLGNTQDVALCYWLKSQGHTTDLQGGGDVDIKPQSNSQTVTTFKAGSIDGAWVPEPYVSQLVAAGGHVLVDEKSLWPGGQFVTTDVLVRTDFLHAHAATVTRFLTGLVDTIQFIQANPSQAQTDANTQLTSLGAPLKSSVLANAWYRHVVLPAALPGFVAGMKQAWAFAWRSLLAGELIVQIAHQPSLGQTLNNASNQNDYAGLMAGMVLLQVVGLLMDALVFGRLERAVLRRRGLAQASEADRSLRRPRSPLIRT